MLARLKPVQPPLQPGALLGLLCYRFQTICTAAGAVHFAMTPPPAKGNDFYARRVFRLCMLVLYIGLAVGLWAAFVALLGRGS